MNPDWYSNAYRLFQSSSNANLFDDLLRDNYDYNRARDSNETRIVTDLPASYIDGGVILKEGVTITREEFHQMSYSEWKEFEQWVEFVPNLVSEEILDRQLLWIYDKVPVITSME